VNHKPDVGTREKRTTLRAIRLTQDLDNVLREDAKAKNLSVNALVYSILTKYAEWDRFAEKFGFITIAQETFDRALELVEDEKLAKLGQELRARLLKEILFFWFKEANLKTLLAFISLFAKYSELIQCEIEAEGKKYAIIYHHNMGQNWTTFTKCYVCEAIRTVVGTAPECESSKREMVFRFHVP